MRAHTRAMHWRVVLFAVVACSGGEPPSLESSARPAAPGSPAGRAVPSTVGSGSAGSAAPDPSAAGGAQVAASEPAPPPDREAIKAIADQACPRVAAPYYYRLEEAGKVSHALGTRHLGVSLAKLPAYVTQQIKRSSLVVFETAPGDDGEGTPAATVSLPTALGPQLWQRYRTLVGAANAALVEQAPPTIALLALMLTYEDTSALLDIEIEQLAAAARLETRGLESSAFQAELLDEVLDLRMLRAVLAGTPDRAALQRQSAEALTEYCAGADETPGIDGRTRAQLVAGGYSAAEIAALDEKLVDARNRAWIPKLEQLLASGNVFVVVGADHLIGERGVVKLLRAKGWKTTRIAP